MCSGAPLEFARRQPSAIAFEGADFSSSAAHLSLIDETTQETE